MSKILIEKISSKVLIIIKVYARDLEDLFRKYGKISDIRFFYNSNDSRCANIEFIDLRDAHAAIRYDMDLFI
jgi:RNA recognition motif-containing protein